MERDVIVAHDVPTFKTNDVTYYSKLNHYRKSEGGGGQRNPPPLDSEHAAQLRFPSSAFSVLQYWANGVKYVFEIISKL